MTNVAECTTLGMAQLRAGMDALKAYEPLRDCPILPMEYQVVVQPDAPKEKTAGGIIIPDSSREADALAADEGILIAVSPLAFGYADWPEGARRPQVGDRVLYKRYEGLFRKPKPGQSGEPLRILSDRSIIAVIEE